MTEMIAATGHTWDSGVVTTQPTYTEQGVRTLTCTSCGTTRTEATEVLPPKLGDIDGDYIITLKDISLLKYYMAGEIGLYDIIQVNSDVDGDGNVTLADISELKYIMAG